MRTRSLGLLAVLALVIAACGGVIPEAAGPSEGIQVHGDWTIDIYNEDGSLDGALRFSNALVAGGGFAAARILSGERTPGEWDIVLEHDPGTAGPCPSQFSELCSETAGTSVTVTGVLELTASMEIEASSELHTARTQIALCPNSIAPIDCTSPTARLQFTSKDLTTLDWNGDGTPGDGPIPVAPGQIVQVQVDISFTSG